MEEITVIAHSENYKFNVTVRVDFNLFYSAILKVAPTGTILHIYGEFQSREQEIDSQSIFEEVIDTLECWSSRYIFKLYDLTGRDYEVRTILQRNGGRSSFYIDLEVTYFYLYERNANYNTDKFQAISIYSPDIDSWLGVTKKQLEIQKNIKRNGIRYIDNPIYNEFSVKLDSNSDLAINYSHSIRNEFNSFQVIREFSPFLNVRFKKHISVEDITVCYTEIISLFYVLTGKKIAIHKIFILTSDGIKSIPYCIHDHSNKEKTAGSFYSSYDTSSLFDHKNNFPLNLFSKYFNLDIEQKELFRKFAYSNSLQVEEDKFLGFFRIVETLTFSECIYFDERLLSEKLECLIEGLCESGVNKRTVKKFVKRIEGLNKRKQNTSALIIRYIESMENEDDNISLSYWIKEIENVAKLRNDLSHGNYVSIPFRKLEEYVMLVKFLSLTLLWNLIGLPINKIRHHTEFRKLFNPLAEQ